MNGGLVAFPWVANIELQPRLERFLNMPQRRAGPLMIRIFRKVDESESTRSQSL